MAISANTTQQWGNYTPEQQAQIARNIQMMMQNPSLIQARSAGQPPPYTPGTYTPPTSFPNQTQNPANVRFTNTVQPYTYNFDPGILNIGNYANKDQREIYDQYLATIGTIGPQQLQAQQQAYAQMQQSINDAWARGRDVYQQQADLRNFGLEVEGFNVANQQFAANYGKDIYGMNRQFDYQDEQNRIDQAYKQGLINNQQYENQTGRLQARYQNAYQQGMLKNQGYENETGRLSANYQNAYQQGLLKNQLYDNTTGRLAQGATERYQTGQLGNQQYANITERQLGQGNLALGQNRLTQEGAVAREQMRSNELQNRYSVFGRAQAPSQQWSRSWA